MRDGNQNLVAESRTFGEPSRRRYALSMIRSGCWQPKIAEVFGVSDRTVLRWIESDPQARAAWKTTQRWSHGVSGYINYRCRCKICADAHREHLREMQRRRLERGPGPDQPHGAASTYKNWGCRCQPCRDAHNDYIRPYVKAFRARQREVHR